MDLLVSIGDAVSYSQRWTVDCQNLSLIWNSIPARALGFVQWWEYFVIKGEYTETESIPSSTLKVYRLHIFLKRSFLMEKLYWRHTRKPQEINSEALFSEHVAVSLIRILPITNDRATQTYSDGDTDLIPCFFFASLPPHKDQYIFFIVFYFCFNRVRQNISWGKKKTLYEGYTFIYMS